VSNLGTWSFCLKPNKLATQRSKKKKEIIKFS